ncbi:MAG: hypothetical protein FK731_11635 [Asgard group archaeon]|nr:hypothetical protein [Asgard group archaeon]
MGTGNHLARMTFAPNRKKYRTSMKVTIEIFDGRNREVILECSNIAQLGSKILNYYKQKTGIDFEMRRFARWFIDYLVDINIEPPEMEKLIRDLNRLIRRFGLEVQ